MRNFGQSKNTDLARANSPVAADDRVRQGCRTRASRDAFLGEKKTACHLQQQGCSRSLQNPSKNAGFTLVEMVAVIVLLSFGLIAGAQLFRMTAESYRDTSARMKQTQDGRFMIERISRELREALPGSVRELTSGSTQCIEWLPIVAASRYLSIPTTASFTVMEINPDMLTGTTYYAVIFPVDTANLYLSGGGAGTALNQLRANPPMVTGAADTDPNTDTINLLNTPSATSFPSSSPGDRIFFVTQPVAVCVLASGNMLRYSNYGFVAQTAVPTTNGVLMAENLLLTDSGAVDIFDYTNATLTRNAMVKLDLRLRDPNTLEVLRLQHTVFVRNVP